jgi:Phage protein Gp138 N-terminal domain
MSAAAIPQLTPDQLAYALTAQWKQILAQALIDTRIAVPGIIQSWDSIKQVASVQVAIREIQRTGSGPQNVEIEPINNVPICGFRAGGFSLLLPIEAGDECLLIFSDMSFDFWWTRGGIQNQTEMRRHDLTDCFFIPGIWSQPNVVSDYPTDGAQLRSDDGNSIVEVTDSQISITAKTVVIQSTSGNTSIDGQAFLPHTHSDVQSGGSDTGPVVT